MIVLDKFYGDIKSVLTKEKLKQNLKLPVYAYIVSFTLGALVLIAIAILKPDISQEAITPEKFGLSSSLSWSHIITNNLKVLLGLFVSGILLYVGPMLVIGLNGFIHGLLLVVFVHSAGAKGLGEYFILMVPHGIFELSGLLFGAGAGIIFSKELVNLFVIRWVNKSRLYEAFLLLVVATCLLLVASVIETQFTFKIQQYLKF